MVMVPLVPALCHQTARKVPPPSADWAWEAKYDGWTCLVERTIAGVVMVSRTGTDYSGQLPYLDEALLWLPIGTILHGELLAPLASASGHGSSAVGSVMTRTAKHVPTALSPALTYVVFDILAAATAWGEVQDTRRLPWATRRSMIEPLVALDHVEVSELLDGTPERALAVALAAGHEGIVAKRRAGRYVPGRSANMVKVKPQKTAEAIVRGFKPGEPGGRFDGMVGAFELEMLDENGNPNGVLTRAKCGDDRIHESATRERDAIARGDTPARADRWLGMPVQIVHSGLSKTGVPRHPQSPIRRDDLVTNEADPPPPDSTPPPMPTTWAGQATRRNYRAMKGPRLEQCIAELRAGAGDAYDRVIAAGADPAKDLDKALAARAKHLNGATA